MTIRENQSFGPQFQTKSVEPLTVSAHRKNKFRLRVPFFAIAIAGLTTTNAFAAFPANISLAGANGTNGFKLSADSYASGSSVSNAGDINADGIEDMIIGAGAPGSDGAGYVVFGRTGVGSSGNFDLSTLDGNNGFKIPGIEFNGFLGSSVSRAGDINGDGVDDMIIGAELVGTKSVPDAGASYVVFGGVGIGNGGIFDLSGLDGHNGFKISGSAIYGQLGSSVSNAGDVNGDGADDLIIGAPGGVNGYGASYVFFGGATIGSGGVVDVSTLNGNNGFKISGTMIYGQLGSSVSNAGDINADGIEDMIIGAPGSSGASYVIFGSSSVGSGGNLDLSALNGSNGFRISGSAVNDHLGSSVSGAGDINGDGVDDVIIGAPGFDIYSPAPGAGYVIFGRSGVGSGGNLDLNSLNGSNGFKISSSAAGDSLGSSVSNAGDINGDNVGDVIIGAPGPDIYSPGASYVVFGKDTTQTNMSFPLSFDANALGTAGFKILGNEFNLNVGSSVSNAGDINHDGHADILIGAPGYGQTYVVFGQAAVSTATPIVHDDLYLFTLWANPEWRGRHIWAPGVLNNDRDPGGGWLSAILDHAFSPVYGNLAFQSDGSFDFTPASNFTEGSFTYRANNGTKSSATTARVRLRANTAPIAKQENCSFDRATNRLKGAACSLLSTDPLILQINVVANDWDPNSRSNVPSDGIGMTLAPSPLMATTLRGAGSTTDNGDGTVTVTLDPGFKGEYQYSYTVDDDLGLRSEAARNIVTVE